MAKDVLQESLIKILRALPQYKPTGSFEAWLRRIVITTALQSYDKSCFRNERTSLDSIAEPLAEPEIYQQLKVEDLIALIRTLPDGFQQVFNLYVIEGYSHKEIAELLQITESTSRSQLTRARKLLQTALKKTNHLSV